MNHSKDEQGTMQALLERMAKERLPELLAIKAKVDKDEKLTEFDLNFLAKVLADATENQALVQRFPECRDVVSKVVSLYRDITARALENEQKTLGG